MPGTCGTRSCAAVIETAANREATQETGRGQFAWARSLRSSSVCLRSSRPASTVEVCRSAKWCLICVDAFRPFRCRRCDFPDGRWHRAAAPAARVDAEEVRAQPPRRRARASNAEGVRLDVLHHLPQRSSSHRRHVANANMQMMKFPAARPRLWKKSSRGTQHRPDAAAPASSGSG